MARLQELWYHDMLNPKIASYKSQRKNVQVRKVQQKIIQIF